MDLNGEMLKKIFTGPKIIDFGSIFVKSTCEKVFHVKLLSIIKYVIIIYLHIFLFS